MERLQSQDRPCFPLLYSTNWQKNRLTFARLLAPKGCKQPPACEGGKSLYTLLMMGPGRSGDPPTRTRRGRQTDLTREEDRLPDGRRIIYYTFEDEEQDNGDQEASGEESR